MVNIIDKVSEFTFHSANSFGIVNVPKDNLVSERLTYTPRFLKGKQISGKMISVEESLKNPQIKKAVVRTFDGEKVELPAELYVVLKGLNDTPRLGIYLPTIKRIE